MNRSALLLSLALSAACSAPLQSALPLSDAPSPPPEHLLAWVGTGEGWRFADGQWLRAPAQDYEFSVIQRRYPERWSSTKALHRYRPDYDGSAGPRDALWHFGLDLSPGEEGRLHAALDTSLGQGEGWTDAAFEDAELEIEADVPALAPFSHYQITQHYDYEAGQLTETVLLFERTEEGDLPFFRSEERATLLRRE